MDHTGATKIQGEKVIEFGAGGSQIDLVRKDTSGSALQKKKDVCTQRLAEKRIGAFAVGGRGVGDAYDGTRWPWRQKGRLEKRPLDLFQMGLPELQVATGDEGSPDGVVKDIFDSKLGNDAGLVVRNPKFFSHFMAPFWWKNICRFDGSEEKEELKMKYQTGSMRLAELKQNRVLQGLPLD